MKPIGLWKKGINAKRKLPELPEIKFFRELYLENYYIWNGCVENYLCGRGFDEDAANERIILDAFTRLIGKIDYLRRLQRKELVSYVLLTLESTAEAYVAAKTGAELMGDVLEYANEALNGNGVAFQEKTNGKMNVMCRVVLPYLSASERLFLHKIKEERLSDSQIAKETWLDDDKIPLYRIGMMYKVRKLFIERINEILTKGECGNTCEKGNSE